jgi:hypothetical protein
MSALSSGKSPTTTTGTQSGGKHAVDLAVVQARQLIARHFRSVANVAAEHVNDAETGEPYVELSFDVRGEVNDVLSAYDAFTSEWVQAYPEEIRRHIRLVYAVV